MKQKARTTVRVEGRVIKVKAHRNAHGCFARAEDNLGNVHRQNYSTLDAEHAMDRCYANFVKKFGDAA